MAYANLGKGIDNIYIHIPTVDGGNPAPVDRWFIP